MFGAVVQNDNPEGGVPSPQLPEPLPHDSGWADNQTGLEHVAAVQACQKHCQLYCLPQAHLISNNAPCSLSVQLPQPFDTWQQQQAISQTHRLRLFCNVITIICPVYQRVWTTRSQQHLVTDTAGQSSCQVCWNKDAKVLCYFNCKVARAAHHGAKISTAVFVT